MQAVHNINFNFLEPVEVNWMLDVVEDGVPAAQMAQFEPPSPTLNACQRTSHPCCRGDQNRGGEAESHTILCEISRNEKRRLRWMANGAVTETQEPGYSQWRQF